MKIVWHKRNLMISSSVVYGHPVKYSYEIPDEFLSESMTRCCNIFGQFYLRKSYFFTLFQSDLFQSITRVIFSERLFLESSCFFWGVPFFRTVTFPQHCLFQNSYFFRAKVLPRNHTLRIGNSLVQLPFGTATHRIYLQKSYFFKADSSAQYQLFQKISKAIFRLTYFFLRATFLKLLS